MSGPQYTPGPWVRGNPPFGEIVYGIDPGEGPGAKILIADCWPSALAERYIWTKETAGRNAQLIAAAPELLAAGEGLAALTVPVQTGGVRLPDTDDARAALTKLLAAVAKAKTHNEEPR